jgi:hypothetical protein
MGHKQDEDPTTMGEIFLMTAATAPVLGAMMSAPIVGGTLALLALFDSLMLLAFGSS